MHIVFNDGRKIPQLGLGFWQTPSGGAAEIVTAALTTGYRHFDTAAVYGNEAGVGQGIAASGIPRADVFVTTKVWNDSQGFDAAQRACRDSLSRLRFDYVDLYLVHWPAPHLNKYVDTWRALIKLREEGLVKSIGVSNFGAEHIERIVGETGVTPAINQIELHAAISATQAAGFPRGARHRHRVLGALGTHAVARRTRDQDNRRQARAARRRRSSSDGIWMRASSSSPRLRGANAWVRTLMSSASRSTPRIAPRLPGSTVPTAAPVPTRRRRLSDMEVVFDIGNVLLRWDPRNLYRKLFDDSETMERFLHEALAMSFIVETDVIASFSAAIETRAAQYPHQARELRAFDTRWLETLGGPIEENVALLRRLRARGQRVHALSNFAHEKFDLATQTYPFLREFDVAVISGREGVAKPDRRIFEILVERVGRPASELLFVDNSLRNVEAARAFGIDTVHYTPGLDLISEFAARGVAEP